VELVFQGFRDELTKRGDAIVSEIDSVLKGAYIEDFDKLAESLKAELIKRMESAVMLPTVPLHIFFGSHCPLEFPQSHHQVCPTKHCRKK
jgi:hypothetical protein